MNKETILMKCKIDISIHKLSIVYDNVLMHLTKDKWYEVVIMKFSISVFDDKHIPYSLSKEDIKEYFYSINELRKIKIKNLIQNNN